MFLFCKMFSNLSLDEKFRNDTNNILEEILNQSGEEG